LFDANGHPAITFASYREEFDNTVQIYYTRSNNMDGSFWPEKPVEVMETAYMNDWTSPLMVDGNPAFATQAAGDYYNSPPVFVRAGDPSGDSWSAPVTIDTDRINTWVGGNLAIINGKPALVWVHTLHGAQGEDIGNEIRYSHALDAQGNNWETVTVGTDMAGSVALAEVDGKPAIGYIDILPPENDADSTHIQGLNYIEALDGNGSTWGSPEVVMPYLGLDYGSFGCRIVDAGGHPGIAFQAYELWEPSREIVFYAVKN
jgi:hypothetical protein